MDETVLHTHIDANFKVCIMFVARYYYKNDNTSNMSHNQRTNGPVNAHLISWPSKANQRSNGPVNAHLISWPSKAQNIQNLEKFMVKK